MPELDLPVRPAKTHLANLAVRKHSVRSFADLGGVWAINAGYTLDLLQKNKINRAYVVDHRITDLSRKRGAKFPQLEFVRGIFNQRDFIADFPEVDALIFYDVLLHQVDLDWDKVLTEWSKKARVLIIYNQMWIRDEKTVRFVERGRDWYKKNVFHNPQFVDSWFDTLDEVEPRFGRKKRDILEYWQWGITYSDLVAHVSSLGFRLDFFQDYGAVRDDYPWIINQGFIFVRREAGR